MLILVTGFDPFGGEKINPSWEAVKLLPDELCGCALAKRLLPTDFARAGRTLLSAMGELSPDAVICTGQAAGRAELSFERVAINLRDASIADNGGYRPSEEAVVPGGEAAYFATLPVKAMAEAVRAAGLPAGLSLSAGSFVCNDVFYTLLRSGVPGAFVHLPLSDAQAQGRTPPPPSMSTEDMARGLAAAIEAAIAALNAV